MIDKDLYDFLKADATLISLLGITGSDPKIYPFEAPQETAKPYILYEYYTPGGVDEWKTETTFNIKIVGDSLSDIEPISNRFFELFDHYNDIQSAWRPTDYMIYTTKINGGGDIHDEGNVGLKEVIRVMLLEVTYKKY